MKDCVKGKLERHRFILFENSLITIIKACTSLEGRQLFYLNKANDCYVAVHVLRIAFENSTISERSI